MTLIAIAGSLGLLSLVWEGKFIGAILLIIVAINGMLAFVMRVTINKELLAYKELEK